MLARSGSEQHRNRGGKGDVCAPGEVDRSRVNRLERRWSSLRDSQLYCRRGSIQLWQFLLALLEDGINGTIIVWTGKGLEFKLVEPEEVSRVVPRHRRN